MGRSVCDAKKACPEIVISLGGACEEKKKKHRQNDAFVFLGDFCII